MTAQNRAQPNPWLVLVALCLGFFMIMLDTTIVNVAIPSLADGLHASLDQVVWVVNAYLLAYAALLIPCGRLGDLWGPRNLFAVGLVVFVVASAACGLAQDIDQLIIARAVQGVGAALLTPQTLTIIATVFPPERRGKAMGVWGSIVGLATVAGPTLGGLLIQVADWRWIFFVNLPLGLLALVGTFRFVPDLRPGRKHRFDLVGVGLSAAGVFLVVFGLLEAERYDWGTIRGPISIPAILVVGAVLLVALVFWERVPAEPLLPLPLFRARNYSLMVTVNGMIAFGMLGLYLPIVLTLQNAAGMGALGVGLTLAPMSLAASVMAPFSGSLADRLGPKYIAATGLTLFAIGLGLMWSAISVDATFLDFLLPTIVAGLGLGTCMAPVAAEAMRSVEPHHAGAASGMLNTTRQLGGLIGTTVVAAVLQARLSGSLGERAREVAAGLDVPAGVREDFVAAFSESSGLQVAGDQVAARISTAGLSSDAVAAVERGAHDVFTGGLVASAGGVLLVPIVIAVLGAIACLTAAGKAKPRPAGTTAPSTSSLTTAATD